MSTDLTFIINDDGSKLIDWISTGKLEIKAYPSEKIHAKVYIMTFHEGDRDKGRVITGSSNFSQSGLQDNLEFNIELKNRSDYEFALKKFNDLWVDAVDVNAAYVDTIQNKSPYAHFTPYKLYLKFLYEYFKGELNLSEELINRYLPVNFMKLKYQDDAVMSAKKILDEYGGVFVSDVVGLGKTYISAMLAQQLDGRTLVLAPPALLDKSNPGSWPNVFLDFHVPQATFESIGKLDDLTIPNVRDLEGFFNKLEKNLKSLDRKNNRDEYLQIVQSNAKNIREKVLKYLMIRRTRSEIGKYYAEDLLEQNLKFPEVSDPEPLFYQFGPIENEVFTRTIELLARGFLYARYKPLEYYVGDKQEGEVQAQKNLAKFMKILFVKRLESSFFAFRLSIERFIHSYERFIEEFRKGHVFISKKHTNKIFEWLDDDNPEAIQDLIDNDKAEKLNAGDFSEKFIKDLENDLQILKEIHLLWQRVRRDPKWEKFKQVLTSKAELKSNKIVIFTESKETATYLAGKIEKDLSEKVILFSGESSPATREIIITNFDARAFQPKDDYRILVTTEVLSEGVNLHRSNIVVNYDIPWNPTRLIQRVGRVNRIDTKFKTIHTYNFFPTNESNDLIKLKEAAEAKIQAFIEMLGSDARLLTDGEEVKSHDLFNQLNSRKTITGESENEESELEYLKEIRSLRDKNPELFSRIKYLPKKARSAKPYSVKDNSLLTYVRKGKLEKFFIADSKSHKAKEVDFFGAVKMLKSVPEQVGAKISADFYALLDKNKQAFVVSTTEDMDDALVSSGRDNATKVLKRLKTKEIKHYEGFTEEGEEFIKNVMRLLEDGALPKPTTKKLAEALSKEINPLKVLGILKRDIPAQFFQATKAEATKDFGSPREVILSEYLVA